MKSWQVSGGDLVIGQGGFQTVTGAARIIQHIRHALSEPLGIDRFHPGWGSLIDEFVGQPLNEGTAWELEQEVNRVIGNFMAVQNEKINRAAARGNSSLYTRADVLSEVSSVDVTYRQDQASILITVSTLSGDEVSTVIEVESA